METKEVVRYILSDIEHRKEILKIPYGGDDYKRKKIENWILIEILPKLLELKERKEVDKAECEHNYDLLTTGPKGKETYPRCDVYWEKNNIKNWLEVKTFRFHRNTGIAPYEERIIEDFDKEQYLKSPYNFNHLLIVFDDNQYDNGNWIEDLYKLYNRYGFVKEDEPRNIELNTRYTVCLFLHHKSEGY